MELALPLLRQSFAAMTAQERARLIAMYGRFGGLFGTVVSVRHAHQGVARPVGLPARGWPWPAAALGVS